MKSTNIITSLFSIQIMFYLILYLCMNPKYSNYSKPEHKLLYPATTNIIHNCENRNVFDTNNIIWTYWNHEKVPDFISRVIFSWKIWFPWATIVIIKPSTIKCFLDEPIIEKIDSPTLKRDAIRLALLEKYGGIWFDSTIVITNNFLIPDSNEFSSVFTEHYSTKPRNFPESWFIKASKNNYIISKWKENLYDVLKLNDYKNLNISETYIYNENTTWAFKKIVDNIGGSQKYWSEYLVTYVSYMYLYETDARFKLIINSNSNSFSSERVGYYLQWKFKWSMNKLNDIFKPHMKIKTIKDLEDSKLLKLSVSNLKNLLKKRNTIWSLLQWSKPTLIDYFLKLEKNKLELQRHFFKLVIIRYNEDISWSNIYQGVRVIYDKSPSRNYFLDTESNLDTSDLQSDEVYHLENIGTEINGILNYIIKNYDFLPAFVGFSQGSDHVMTRKKFYGPLMFLNMLKEAAENGCSKPLLEGQPDNVGSLFSTTLLENSNLRRISSCTKDFREWMTQNSFQSLDKLYVYPSSLMVISRENIYKRSRAYYMDLLKYVNCSKAPSDGHYMERSWYYIFQCEYQLS